MTSDNTASEQDVDIESTSRPSSEFELAEVEPCLSLICSFCILILVFVTLGMSFGTMMTADALAGIAGVGLSALTLAVFLVAIQIYKSHEVRSRDSGQT